MSEEILTTKKQKSDKKEISLTSKKKSRRKLDKYEEILNQLYPPEENENFNKENSQDKTKKKQQKSNALTTKRKKNIKKSKAERQKEILHDMYPPVTDSGTRASIENHYRDIADVTKDNNELSKVKPKKTKAEREEEFFNKLYPPVTLNEDWLREYESKLVPTVPQNISRNDFIRGFYTFAPYENGLSTQVENSGNDTSKNQGKCKS